MSCLFCNHVFNELSDAFSNLASLYSDSTAWVLLHVNTSKLNNLKGQSSSNRTSLFYEAFHNKLQIILLFEYSTFCTALFLGFQIASRKAVDGEFL